MHFISTALLGFTYWYFISVLSSLLLFKLQQIMIFFFGHGYFIVFEEESVIVGRSDPQLGGVVMEARSALPGI